MLGNETQNLEFKQEYVPGIRKEVIAFANAEGGTILVGVRKDGVVIGIGNPDEVMLQIANSLKDSIVPDIMPFVDIRAIELEHKQVIQIEVAIGTNCPYYLKEKGLRPSGVYVRKGSSSQPMSDEGIREMIIENSGHSYETERSLNQNLTFDVIASEMKKRNIEFGSSQKKTLKLVGEDDLYTNLAFIVSDQFETTTKVAFFQGSDKAIFRSRREFSGSILKQLEEVYQYLDIYNKTKATFSGLDRIDTRDYPEEAVREALLNSFVHRDYSVQASNLINVYDDRIEFVSIGGLVSGIELSSIFLGISRTRNPNLASLFYRMHLIESYGTGIEKIQRAYEEKKPIFETAKGVFRVTLFNQNEHSSKTELDTIRNKESLDDQRRRLLEYARTNNGITRKEAQDLLASGSTKAFRLLKELCDLGQLRAVGNGRLSKYIPK